MRHLISCFGIVFAAGAAILAAVVWPQFSNFIQGVLPIGALIWCGMLSDRLQNTERELRNARAEVEGLRNWCWRIEDAVR